VLTTDRRLTAHEARTALRLLRLVTSVLGCACDVPTPDGRGHLTCRLAKLAVADYCAACEAAAFLETIGSERVKDRRQQ
jgi:hypothetical protein